MNLDSKIFRNIYSFDKKIEIKTTKQSQTECYIYWKKKTKPEFWLIFIAMKTLKLY